MKSDMGLKKIKIETLKEETGGETIKSDMSMRSCSSRKRKKIQSGEKSDMGLKKIKIETLKEETGDETIKSDLSMRSCSSRKGKKIQSGEKSDMGLKKIKIESLKEETGDETIKSDMGLKICSSRKRKKIQSGEKSDMGLKKIKIETLKEETGDETIKSDMGLEICSKKRKRRKKELRIKEGGMVSLLPRFRLGRFLGPKKDKTRYSQPFKLWRLRMPKLKKNQIKKGDIVNLSQLLFTKDRDYLITNNHRDCPVRAEHLEGKVVVLLFAPLVPWSEDSTMRHDTTILLDMYHVLQPKGGFEVVFVGVPVDTAAASNPDSSSLNNSTLEKCFEDIFSIMPWTAIPFSDIKSRKYLERRFPLSGFLTKESSTLFVIDPTGMVSQCWAGNRFFWYGARAYPFTDKRMETLSYEEEETLKHPSITKLLASPERNHLIDNNNQVVPLHNLEDKVVGLYFYEDYGDDLTIKIKEAYERLAKEKNFEIVLVYIHDAYINFNRTSEESYWKSFQTMPWLALPFKDPACKKLQRIFDLPMDAVDTGPDPRLVIIGRRGKFVERYGADILKEYGISAYPFTRKRVAKIEAEYVKELKLDMFFDSNASFIRKDGFTVQFSQLVGKRIILIIEDEQYTPEAKFWRMLRARYLQMKGRNDEFEVIHICTKEKGYSFGKNIATSSWLRHPGFSRGSSQCMLLIRLFMRPVGLLCFDHDGRVVRRAFSPSIGRGNLEFPFDAGGVEKEVLRELKDRFHWDS